MLRQRYPELQSRLVAFEVMEWAEMKSQNVCSDEYLEREIGRDAEFVPYEIFI